jgi:hypothetical protein
VSSTEAGPRRAKSTAKKKPFWQMELGKGKHDDDDVDHPPFVATLPRANLLPVGVRNSIAVRRTRRFLIWALVLLVAVVAGGWYLQSGAISDAESSLAQAKQEGAALQDKVDALTAVTEFSQQLQAQQALVKATLASQPQSSLVIERLAKAGSAASQGSQPVAFANVGVTYTGIPPAGGPFNTCPNPDPFGTELTIGCVSFTATAANPLQVSQVLEVLDADPMFVGPYVTSTQIGDLGAGSAKSTAVTFNGTAGISLDGLMEALTPEQVDAIVNPPKPASDDKESKASSTEKAS